MSATLRIELLLISIIFLGYIVRGINKNVFLLENAISWLAIAAGLVLFAIFPSIPEWLSQKLGFETTSNFLLLLAIFVLLIMEIHHSIAMSKQQTQIKTLIQELSVLKSKNEEEKK